MAAIGADRIGPVKRAASLTVPVLVIGGGANLAVMPFMHATVSVLAKAIPPRSIAPWKARRTM